MALMRRWKKVTESEWKLISKKQPVTTPPEYYSIPPLEKGGSRGIYLKKELSKLKVM